MLSICRQFFNHPNPYRSAFHTSPASAQAATATKPLSNTVNSRLAELGLPDSETLQLPDNRHLGYIQYGDLSPTSNAALFYFHGLPSSRFECAEFDPFAKKHNIRLIAIDRPGMGLSTFEPNRQILDWPNDVLRLANHLQLDTFRVMGSSGGSPYALACAHSLPHDRLKGVGILAGSGPPEAGTAGLPLWGRIIWQIWKWAPSTFELGSRSTVKAAQDPDPTKMDEHWDTVKRWLSKGDREAIFGDETVRKLTVETFRAAHIQGTAGPGLDAKLLALPWGFQIEDVGFDGVKMWYGDRDTNTPLQMARYMADRLPGSKLKIYPGVTHMTTWSDGRAEEILKEMMDL